ncbi:MAG: ABC transporter permease [Denitrovibrio sp.]|nr:MAG: ABC transporter permease [Denitrovibrio sp.]
MNIKLFEYALLSLTRRRTKHLFIFTILTLLLSISLSIFTISNSIRQEAEYSVNNLPDITVQKQIGGRQQYLDEALIDDIIVIPGVLSATPRVWGYYNFEYLNTNLTIIGLDPFDPDMSKTLTKITNEIDTSYIINEKSIIIGEQLHKIIKEIYNKDEFSFQTPSGDYITLPITSTFESASNMLSTDIVLTNLSSASSILGIETGLATDIAINVSNPQELSTITEKIENMSPSFKVITKDQIIAYYQNMFDYKAGIFLLFFLSSLFTFFMIVFDKLSGLTNEETKEIAILKSVGWETRNVLQVKIYESVIIAFTAFILSICLSIFYVYFLQAPGLQNIFMGYSYLKPHFELTYKFDLNLLITVFFVTIPLYIAAVVIPAWKAAITDPGEVMR